MAGFRRGAEKPEKGGRLTLGDIPGGFERAKFSNPFLDMAGPYYVRSDEEYIVVSDVVVMAKEGGGL